MGRFILSIDDLSDGEIDNILHRAAGFESGLPVPRLSGIMGSFFLQTSLRTRVGFSAAAARLGMSVVDIDDRRHDETSMVESWHDTLRTLSGYLDVLVARPGDQLERATIAGALEIPYLSGGSTGRESEHPSQALIDIHAIQSLRGDIGDLSIAICGDLRMRAPRSLLRLLARRLPKQLIIVSDPTMLAGVSYPRELDNRIEVMPLSEATDADVIYVAGIPHGAVPEAVRSVLRIQAEWLENLPPKTVILSPMPIIDEIGDDVRTNHRFKAYEQSDSALFVRIAILEWLIGSEA